MERLPERGWWTPEFRELVEAMQRGECPQELLVLDEAAARAGDGLVSSERHFNAIAAAALGVGLALEEKRYAEARRLTDELVDLADELRARAVEAASQAGGSSPLKI